MNQLTKEQLHAHDLRVCAYHEAGHKIMYRRFGGDGDAVVWKNLSDNPDEMAWRAHFRPRTCPQVMHDIAKQAGFPAADLPDNWRALFGMAGLVAEEILRGETELEFIDGALYVRIVCGEVSAMLLPRFDFLAKQEDAAPSIIYASGSPSLSANPRLYKYVWQILSHQSLHEGNEFFEREPFVCTADMVEKTQRLLSSGQTCVVYGLTRPRQGKDTPWDRTHPRWHNAIFAPSWADDTDPLTIGGYK